MRKPLLKNLLAVAALAVIAQQPLLAQSTAVDAERIVPGRILVMPRAGLPDSALSTILKEHGASASRRVGQSALRVVDLPKGLEKQAVERLSKNPHIKFAEVDAIVAPSYTTNDPYLGSQWHLPKIGATTAWDSSMGAGVTIAILDSGVNGAHPDLAGSMVAGYNFNQSNTDTNDVYGHGTSVAGSAAATANNGVGVSAVAGKARIMPLRITDATGYTTFSQVSSALTYAADHGARVANISFGGTITSASVISAAQYLKGKNGLAFFSAGNTGSNPGWTGSPDIVVVSGTDSNDAIASWSSFGSYVQLAAPGVGIYTTNWTLGYSSVNGTSFSSPVAAGVAALVMAANPKLTGADVQNILFKTAVDLGAGGKDPYYGYGRVNADAAVKMALSTVSVTDTASPTTAVSSPSGGSSASGLVTVNVSASDNVGVNKVDLLVNGAVVATDVATPYAFTWDSTKVANGTATLVAKAYDAAGNVGQSAPVSVTVSNTTSSSTTPVTTDTTAPVGVISNPVNGSTVNGQVSISASASDNGGLSGLAMSLYIDGSLVASSSGTGSLNYTWNARKTNAGTHTITLQSRDRAGNVSSTSVGVRR